MTLQPSRRRVSEAEKIDRFLALPADFPRRVARLHPVMADEPEAALALEPFRCER
jgi:hypothetical protein